MKKVLIITGDRKKVEGFAHEQRYRFRRDGMTAELKDADDGKADAYGDSKEAPKEDVKDAPQGDTKDAPEDDSKDVKEDKKTPKKTDKK